MLSEILSGLRARLLNTSSLAQESVRDGQTFFQSFFQNTVVDNTPAFLLDNNFVRLLNFGQITTNNAPAAISVPGEDADIFNFRSGRIEANNGPDALATAIDVTGSADIRNFGEIVGEFNGVSFSGAQSSGSLDNFRGGVISSDSRAVNIQGDGVSVRNFGDIIGTGDQRNGTIYTDAVAENFSISNFTGGTIDAGDGNLGAGVSLQVGDVLGDVVSGNIVNSFGGVIQGRGQAASNTALAGDGIRINNGAEGTIFDSNIVNSGLVSSESNQGTAAGIRVADGQAFDGQILNTQTGVIEGVRNGLYIGEAEHDLDVLNFGTIQSDSRAVNIDGTGVNLLNGGDILGTDDQRNGTVYADGTADDFSVSNLVNGTIDAGFGNQGSGFGVEIGGTEDGASTFELNNAGLIQGRGNASAGVNAAGDGVRIGNVGNIGVTDAIINNSGVIDSEGANGTVAGVRFVNGVSFQGELNNSGTISGVQNGLYFGYPVNGEGADHTGGVVNNLEGGVISSGSRALNIDGNGLEINNAGQILGTGDQRNGTVYADATADNYVLNNTSTGVIDAGLGNNGSGVSLQTGDVSNDIVSGSVFNEGVIQGRGDAEAGNTIGDGLRVFSSQEDTGLAGVIQNDGLIAGSEESPEAAGIRVDGGVDLLGAIINDGEIRGTVNAIDATDGGFVTIVNDEDGVINGNVLLGDEADVLVDLGTINGDVDGGAGDDVLIIGEGDNTIVGGLGNDFIDGGEGIDTADFSDLDVPVTVVLDANGNGTATRETGFSVTVEDVIVDTPVQGPPNTQIENAADFVTEAVAGNLYYNIHTADFPAGEIRGQLFVVEGGDVTEGNIRTITLAGDLDASQEPGPTSDSEATGTATLVITQNLLTGEVSYSSELSVVGLAESDLLTPIPGVVSAIHLHNAPAGINGGVAQDTLVDAGAFIDGNEPTGVSGPDVIDNVIETDVLFSIENIIGSDDGDTIIANGGAPNTLLGEGGDDFLAGGGATDIIDGGEGVDTNSFFNINGALDLDNEDALEDGGVVVTLNADGSGTANYVVGGIVDGVEQGPNIFEEFTGIENIEGTNNNDSIIATGGAVNSIFAGEGDNFVQGGGGSDITDGGEGIDTVSFADIGSSVTVDLEAERAEYLAPNGNLIVDEVTNFENVVGSANDDDITGDAGDNVVTGGLGSDLIDGGEGFDTADFSDLDVDIIIGEDADGNTTVTRETGFSVSVNNVSVGAPVQGPPNTQIENAADFVDQAVAGNLYYNIHTADFPAGEIRGQLFVVEGGDVTEGNIRTITLAGDLDASQEPGPTSDSEATGTASLVITKNLLTGEVTYSSELSVVGLEESDLLTPIPGAVSAIHLHNAPAGVNGGVVQDTLVDAGATIDAVSPSGVSGLDVIDNVIETDTLISIENIIDADGNVIPVDGAAPLAPEAPEAPEEVVMEVDLYRKSAGLERA